MHFTAMSRSVMMPYSRHPHRRSALHDRRAEIAKLLAEWKEGSPLRIDVRAVDVLPLLSNGKVDYKALEANS